MRQSKDRGASLLVVLMSVLVVTGLLTSILALAGESKSALDFEQHHTQALYNARMGIDATILFLKRDISTDSFTQSTGHQDLQNQVVSDLGTLTSPPFHVSIQIQEPTSKAPSVGTTLYSMQVSLKSTGYDGDASVGVGLNVSLTYKQTTTGGSSGGTGTSGGSTGTSGVILTGFGGATGNIGTVTSGSGLSIQGGGTLTVSGSGSSATVSPTPSNEVTTSYQGNLSGTVWVQGDGATVSSRGKGKEASINGTAIITGNQCTVNANVKGSLIVTGSGTTIKGNVSGPAFLMGVGTANAPTTFNGIMNCGGIITGDYVNVKQGVNGPLVVMGNHVTVTGNVTGELVVIGNDFTLNGNATHSMYSIGSNEFVNGQVTGGLVDNNANTTVTQGVNGGTMQFDGSPITLTSDCLGTVTLNFPPSGGSGNTNVQVQINFSSSTITA